MDFYTDKDGKIESQSDENISIEQQVLNSEKALETSEAKPKTTTRVLNYLQIYLLLALATLITAVIGISYPYLIQLLANHFLFKHCNGIYCTFHPRHCFITYMFDSYERMYGYYFCSDNYALH